MGYYYTTAVNHLELTQKFELYELSESKKRLRLDPAGIELRWATVTDFLVDLPPVTRSGAYTSVYTRDQTKTEAKI